MNLSSFIWNDFSVCKAIKDHFSIISGWYVIWSSSPKNLPEKKWKDNSLISRKTCVFVDLISVCLLCFFSMASLFKIPKKKRPDESDSSQTHMLSPLSRLQSINQEPEAVCCTCFYHSASHEVVFLLLKMVLFLYLFFQMFLPACVTF